MGGGLSFDPGFSVTATRAVGGREKITAGKVIEIKKINLGQKWRESENATEQRTRAKRNLVIHQ